MAARVRMSFELNRVVAMAEARRISRRPVTDTTRRVMNVASVLCPVDTGLLRARHRMKVSESKTMVKGTVSNSTKYAAAVHDGSDPHQITARRRRVLRFMAGDVPVFRRSVWHPGCKARPWMKQAAMTVAAQTGATFSDK